MSQSGDISILAGRLGRLERYAAAARAQTLYSQRKLEEIDRKLDNFRLFFGSLVLYASDATILQLDNNMAVASGKTIDGVDVSTLSTAVSDITTLQGQVTELVNGLTNGNLWLPVSAMSNRDAVTIAYSNNQEYGTLSSSASGSSRFAGGILIPTDFLASSTPDLYCWHVVAAAGGTNGQDVVYRINTATSASGEVTGTNGAQVDVTIDIPDATQNTLYRTKVIDNLSNVTALDMLTIHFDRRGADGSDTLAANTGLVGFELLYTRDVT